MMIFSSAMDFRFRCVFFHEKVESAWQRKDRLCLLSAKDETYYVFEGCIITSLQPTSRRNKSWYTGSQTTVYCVKNVLLI